MEDYRKAYEEWLNDPYFDEGTRAELKAIENDDKVIRERFYTALEFGTAGLRGIIGAGTNRMNQYVVQRATQGLANYIVRAGGQKKGVAIAYDSRLCYKRIPFLPRLSMPESERIYQTRFPFLSPQSGHRPVCADKTDSVPQSD